MSRFSFIAALFIVLSTLIPTAQAQNQGSVEILFQVNFEEIEQYSIYNVRNDIWSHSQKSASFEVEALAPPGENDLVQISLRPGRYILRVLEHDLPFKVSSGERTFLAVSADGYPLHQYGPDLDGDSINNDNDDCPIQPEDLNYYQDNDGCPDGVPILFRSEVDYHVNLILEVYNPQEEVDYMSYFSERGEQLLMANGTFRTSVIPGRYRLKVAPDEIPDDETDPETFEVEVGGKVQVLVRDLGFGPEVMISVTKSSVSTSEPDPGPQKTVFGEVMSMVGSETNPVAQPPKAGVVIGYHLAIGQFGSGLDHSDPKDRLGNQSGMWLGGEAAFNRYLVSVQGLLAYDSLMPVRPWAVGFQASAGLDFTHARCWWGWQYQAQGIDTTLGYHYNHDAFFVAIDINPLQYVWNNGDQLHFGGGYNYDGYGYQKKGNVRGLRLVNYPFWYIKLNSSF